MDNNYVIIMAGGVGSRFWPLSRSNKPKQFLDILGTGETLIQQTFRRFKSVCREENIFVVTNSDHKELVIEQLGISADRVLAEPFRRNTAPCIAYGTFRIMVENPNALIAVTPADHHIVREDNFSLLIRQAFDFVGKNDALLTIGITPDKPETGYGYIKADTKGRIDGFDNFRKVEAFTEKPDIKLAKVFLESGDYYWNSGIFFWSINTILNAFERYLPDIYNDFNYARDLFGTEIEDSFIAKSYESCQSISIDCGIIEKADNVYVAFSEIGWSDLGTWSSLYDHSAFDENGNALIGGKVLSYENKGNIIRIPADKVAMIQGLTDYIIVDTDDALLIIKKEEEQNIKKYLEDLKILNQNKLI